MPPVRFLRVVAFVVGLSTLAPSLLAIAGVRDVDLLIVVFVPSVVVGAATAWYAARHPVRRRAWQVDTQRMP